MGCLLTGLLLCGSDRVAQAASGHDGSHDFDFEFGTWRTHVKLLQNPLAAGSKRWVEYDGKSLVRRVWNGAANLVELDVRSSSAGHLQLASFRLYDPIAGHWSL